MLVFHRGTLAHLRLSFIIFLWAPSVVRADYFTAVWRLWSAFEIFHLPIPSGARPDQALLDTHDEYLTGNYSQYEEAEIKLLDGEISETEWESQTDQAVKGLQRTSYQLIADYMGVGVHTHCEEDINVVLAGATEYEKAGQQAASVLMALLPALLTFGNLFVPRSSEAFGTSFMIGFMSALFGFGLPVKSISAVPVKQTILLSRLSWSASTDIGKLGESDGKRVVHTKLSDLQKWSDDRGGQISAADRCFAGISHAALDWRSRTHWWHLPSFLVAGCQSIILFLCVFPLFMGVGVPNLLFDCSATITSIYLVATALLSSITRFLMWETSSHERVHVFALSDSAEQQLRQIADKIPNDHSTINELPPLQAPLLVRPLVSMRRNLARFWDAAKRLKRGMAQHHSVPAPPQFSRADGDGSYRMIPIQFAKVLVARLRWIMTNIVTFYLSGFKSQNAAIRWRPLIVLCHLSTTGRNPLKTLFTGIVEGGVLLVLTFFFSAQWAGNLIVTLYSVAYLLVAVSVARGLGLLYIRWSVRSAGLHVVECESVEEIYGSLRALCSMKHLLVRVNGAWYFEGTRMDRSPDYWDWELRSERGEFDDEKKSFKVLGVPRASSVTSLPSNSPSGQVAAVSHRSTM